MPADVVELIKNDHREVERVFDLMKQRPAARGLNFPVLSALLMGSPVQATARKEEIKTELLEHAEQSGE